MCRGRSRCALSSSDSKPCFRPVETRNSSRGRCLCFVLQVKPWTGFDDSTGTEPRSRTCQTTSDPLICQAAVQRLAQLSRITSRVRASSRLPYDDISPSRTHESERTWGTAFGFTAPDHQLVRHPAAVDHN